MQGNELFYCLVKKLHCVRRPTADSAAVLCAKGRRGEEGAHHHRADHSAQDAQGAGGLAPILTASVLVLGSLVFRPSVLTGCGLQWWALTEMPSPILKAVDAA